MKTITIKLYDFKELSKEVQTKVIEKNRDINVDFDQWHDYITEEWKEKLKLLGFENPNIMFSGFSSQGDGACFTCERIDFDIFAGGKYKGLDIRATISHSYRYYFATSTTVNLEAGDDVNDELYNEIEKAIETAREELGNELYKELDENYFSLISDENVRETLISNEYTYEANGKMRNI